MAGTSRRIVIIGGGIVGAAIAYALTRRGASVSVVEADRIGGGVTQQAFGWLHHTAPPNDPTLKLRHAALEEYRRLEHATGGHVSVDWCGALTWFGSTAETETFIQQQAGMGLDVRGVDAVEFGMLEPGVTEPPPLAAFAVREGAVNAVEITRRLMGLAQTLEADLITGQRVTGILTSGPRVTGIALGTDTIPADTVVLAAGTQGAPLVAPLGIALDIAASPAILLRPPDPAPAASANCLRPGIRSPTGRSGNPCRRRRLSGPGWRERAGGNRPKSA